MKKRSAFWIIAAVVIAALSLVFALRWEVLAYSKQYQTPGLLVSQVLVEQSQSREFEGLRFMSTAIVVDSMFLFGTISTLVYVVVRLHRRRQGVNHSALEEKK